MQGLAFLVTFGAIAKSDWPRAAIERAGGKRKAPFKQTQRPSSGRADYCVHGSTGSPRKGNAFIFIPPPPHPNLPCRPHSRKHALAVPAADRMRSETPPTPRDGRGDKPSINTIPQ